MKKQIEIDPNTNLPKLPEGDFWEVVGYSRSVELRWMTPRLNRKGESRGKYKCKRSSLGISPDYVLYRAIEMIEWQEEAMKYEALVEEVIDKYPPGKLDTSKQKVKSDED